MSPDPSRRRVLQLTGIGATTSLAGCSQLGISDDGSDDELDADAEPDIDPSDGITAIVQPSQEELAKVEQEIGAEIESGELDQEEAQLEFRERQQELFVSRSVEFESEMAEDDDVSIEAGIGEQGAFLLDASDERLIDTLRNGEVDALLPGEEYAEALRAQEQSAPEQTEPAPEDDRTDDGGDEAGDGPDEAADESDDTEEGDGSDD